MRQRECRAFKGVFSGRPAEGKTGTQSYNICYNPLVEGSNRMSILKVTTVGNSVGVILPKEILERLRVGKGDSLYVIETKQGIELTAYNPEFAAQVEIAERVMREDRDALRKLAE